MIGSTVSRYRILAKLGGGGMGVVYEAEDTELGRHVAIKFLPEDAAPNLDALERFKREARAASALAHPHICVVHDVGSHEGRPYLVMERLKGQTLNHAIGNRPMPTDRVVSLGEQFADALEAAHRAGIVHRDLKPANLFVTERGDAKILDFGLAKVATATDGRAVDAAAPTVAAEFLTEAGTTLGTVAYMSPEQARGQVVDARSDLFSLGVVLYEMATGRPPFAGESAAELFAAILKSEPVPPSESNPEVPAGLERVIVKALEKDPALRHQTAAGLRGDLLRLKRDASVEASASARGTALEGEKLPPQGKDSSGSRRGLWVGLGAAAVVAALALAYFSTGRSSPGGAKGATGAPAEAGSPGSPPVAAAPEKSIAVLPFVNMSSDEEQEYFSDGISEELLNLLAKVPELKVTARTSSFSFKGKDVGIPEIARQLGVAHVLEGSVRKSGSKVRITAQLIHAVDGFHLWSQTYDRELDDIFKIQDEIAGDVVRALKVTLLGSAPKARTTDPRAYALYLQAVHLARLFTVESFAESDALFRQVLEIDPSFAPAWDGLSSNYYNETIWFSLLPSSEGGARAREAAEKALAIDPDYARAHAALGMIAMDFENDPGAAVKHFERALQLDPADSAILGNAAWMMTTLGRPDEAFALYDAVLRRDPLDTSTLFNLGSQQLYARRFDEAIASNRKVLSLVPGTGGAHFQIGSALLFQGDAAAALAEIERETSEVWRTSGLPMAYHALEREPESDAALAALIAEHGKDAAYAVAMACAIRGETDRAFEWLDRAVEYGDPNLTIVAVDPTLDSLRGDPRWLPFLRRIGRAPEQLAEIEFHVTLPE
jgi:serine/threonine protein kinase/tetratricopeptide (TPR) repeat protein